MMKQFQTLEKTKIMEKHKRIELRVNNKVLERSEMIDFYRVTNGDRIEQLA